MVRLAIALLALALAAPAGAETPAPTAPEAAMVSEPLWISVALAPGRIVGHGRFDAASPSYHAQRAAEKAEAAAAARAERCHECDCAAEAAPPR